MNESMAGHRNTALIQGVWFEGAMFARIMMQTIWITVWYQALMNHRVGWSAAGLALFLALFVSTLLVRWFSLRKEWRKGLKPALFAVWMVLFFLASLRWLVWPGEDINLFQTIPLLISEFGKFPFDMGIIWHLLLVPVLIWQGVNLGNSRGSLSDTIQGFKIGILLLIVHGLIFMPEINLVNSLPWLAYLVLGLVATSVNRMADLIPLRGGRLPSSTGQWWAAIFVSAIVLIALSMLAGGILHNVVRIGIYVTIGMVLLPSAAILLCFAFLIYLIITWLNPQFTLSIGQILDSIGAPLAAFLENDRLMKNWEKIGRHTVDEYLIPALVALGIVIVVIFIFVDLRSRRSWIRRTLTEENVSDIFERFKLRPRQDADKPRGKGGWSARRFLAAARIRAIYADLLELSARAGSPRLPAQTPLEFLPVLGAVFPDQAADAQLITSAYLKVRYGGFPESASEVRDVETAWRSLQAQGRALILAKKREVKERDRL